MSELSDKLASMPEIVLKSVHVGLVEVPTTWVQSSKETTLVDEWKCTLSYNGKEYSTTYRTGIGCRKLLSGVKKERGGYATRYDAPVSMETAVKKGWLKLVSPDIADVVGCLASDARGGANTFEDFCCEFGYDDDSRRAFAIYIECQGALNGMRRLLGYDLLTELQSLEH